MKTCIHLQRASGHLFWELQWHCSLGCCVSCIDHVIVIRAIGLSTKSFSKRSWHPADEGTLHECSVLSLLFVGTWKPVYICKWLFSLHACAYIVILFWQIHLHCSFLSCSELHRSSCNGSSAVVLWHRAG